MVDAIMRLVEARIPLDRGAVVIAGAGNESHREIKPDYEIAVSLPAAAEGVISVGALQRAANQFAVLDFSNTLPEISGPGVAILGEDGWRPARAERNQHGDAICRRCRRALVAAGRGLFPHHSVC